MKLPQARNKEIVEQELNNELLIYNLQLNKAYVLNETSKIIFQACNGKTTFDDLKRKHKFTEELIYLTIDQLKKEDLIFEDYQSKFAGVSRRELIKRAGLGSMIMLPVVASLTFPSALMAASCGDTSSNPNNCGTCGTVCIAPTATCCSGSCVNLNGGNINNCGSCGTVCSGVRPACCSGFCRDLDSNPNNCGSCGNACSFGNTCVSGVCVPVP